MGFVWPEEGANPFIDAARETLATIERLDPAVVIPGHGAPFMDAPAAVARVRGKLDAFARDPAKNARHVIKSMFVFALLDKGSMPLADVPGYLARVPCYRIVSERFLTVPFAGLAEWLVGDLQRSGAIAVAAGVLRPTAIA
jgi:glyoxylase-like metal-dependent hydrolase (beta-lactamase superfamily II)